MCNKMNLAVAIFGAERVGGTVNVPLIDVNGVFQPRTIHMPDLLLWLNTNHPTELQDCLHKARIAYITSDELTRDLLRLSYAIVEAMEPEHA